MRVIITHKYAMTEFSKDGMFGGAERISWQLAEQLAKNGIDVTLIGHNEKEEMFFNPFHFIGVSRDGFGTKTCQVIKSLMDEHSIIHMGSHNMMFFVPELWSYPTVLHFHDRVDLLHMADGKNVTHKIFVSEYQRRQWDELRKIPVGYHSIIPSLIDLDEIGEPNYQKDPFVLYVGAIALEKGAYEFMRIAKYLPKVNFIMIGSGELWGRPDEDKNIPSIPNLSWLGFMSRLDTIRWIKKASVVVLPSHFGDPCPIVPLEAQACGTPIVASLDGGIPEIVHNNSFLVPLKDWSQENFPIASFVNKIQFLMDNSDVLKQVGQTGRQFVEEKFTWQKGIQRYLELYSGMVR